MSTMKTPADPYPQAPRFTSNNGLSVPPLSNTAATALATRGTPATLNLDDIFGDCFFTPEGETVFLSDQPENIRQEFVQSTEATPANVASRVGENGVVVPVLQAAGISSTHLDTPGHAAAVMGTLSTNNGQQPPQSVPFKSHPQREHHMGYIAAPHGAEQLKPTVPHSTTTAPRDIKKRRQRPGTERKMSEQQKVERRERNREHAKRSRIRKKFLLESLQQSVTLLKEENDNLRGSIRTHLGDSQADELLTKKNLEEQSAAAAAAGLIANNSSDANKVLDDPDFSFIKALQTAQQNFVVTDPSLPDNPIVYATQGFLNLTGYTLDQVLGRNCRFLQGPETDPKAVEKIRKSIEYGTDMSVCLLNYRVDGTTFWNQFFIAALRDAAGNITNYVGVQCKVSDQYAATVCRKQEEAEQDADQDGGKECDDMDDDDFNEESMTDAPAQGQS